MNLQIKKLNDSELDTIFGGEHKQISVLSLEDVRRNGFHPASNQTYFVDDNGNYHVTTIYTDKEWADKLKFYAGTSICAAVVFVLAVSLYVYIK